MGSTKDSVLDGELPKLAKGDAEERNVSSTPPLRGFGPVWEEAAPLNASNSQPGTPLLKSAILARNAGGGGAFSLTTFSPVVREYIWDVGGQNSISPHIPSGELSHH